MSGVENVEIPLTTDDEAALFSIGEAAARRGGEALADALKVAKRTASLDELTEDETRTLCKELAWKVLRAVQQPTADAQAVHAEAIARHVLTSKEWAGANPVEALAYVRGIHAVADMLRNVE